MPMDDRQRLMLQMNRPLATELWKAIQPLKSCVSFMNSGAHPDDETTAMLAALGLRDGVKLSHACSTRGEGGQNALGPETIHELGAIRTREMERAAEVLNISQYWLSTSPDDTIFDFGFSKSGEETLRHWDEDRVIERFVFILRTERPDILCPTFLDVPGQHGHHRAMTQCAFKAVTHAADPYAFPDQGLAPWQVKKLYLPAWSGAGDSYDDDEPPPPATVAIDGSGGDPALGADYVQIAQWSRAFHATQGMGKWIAKGTPANWPLHLAVDASGNAGPEESVFDNLPRTLGDLAAYAGAESIGKSLGEAQAEIDAILAAWPNRAAVMEHTTTALKLVREAATHCPEDVAAEVLHRLAAKEAQLMVVATLTAGIDARLWSSANEFHPGEEIELRLQIENAPDGCTAELLAPTDWSVTRSGPGTWTVGVPETAAPTNPYPDTWLPGIGNGDISALIRWTGDNGQKLQTLVQPEDRLSILPARSVAVSPEAGLINLHDPRSLNFRTDQVFPPDATVSVFPEGEWSVQQAGDQISLIPTGDPVAGLTEFPVLVNAEAAHTVTRMDYAHIGPTFLARPAIIRVRVLDAVLPTARVGYVAGGSDRTNFWLRQAGLDVHDVSDADIESGDFARFDSLLIGIFAFRTRPALMSSIANIHEWVRAGGNLVTLYHRPWDNWDPERAPLARLSIGKPSLRWRVTDENAEVLHLVPGHELLTHPNVIGPEDWQGWHKERGLYFANDWDDAYAPLLSMADPGEDPHSGAMLTGRFGRGRHTHTSLILHHQVAKLVPGAYRLLANLLNSAA